MENNGYNAAVEEFQNSEYPMLQGKTYLDHAGTTVYAKSLVDAFARDLTSNLYGNPHLGSPPAKLLNQVVDDTRERALRFFGADPEHFDLVFVANTTTAIKLITECFKNLSSTSSNAEGGGFWYGYHVDSHYSAIGVRENTDSEFHLFRSDKEVDQWLTGSLLLNPTHKLGLFAYPGQSNMTGRRLPQRWPVLLRRSSNASQRDTYSLLDAADLASSYPLHTIFQDPHEAPDFTAVSFYKIFGFPDLGGLIIRKASGNILQYQKYVGGGTVSLIKTPEGSDSRTAKPESLEDGTLPVHSIIALDAAISTHESLYGSEPMFTILQHTNFLIKRLYDSMCSLHHTNGIPICKIYKSHKSAYGESSTQGATISFNLIRTDGTYVTSSSAVEKLADENNIFVRAGQLFNPSDIATHLGYEKWRNERLPSSHNQRLGDPEIGGTEGFYGRPTGVVRVSLGAMTTLENIETLIEFLREEFIRPIIPDKNPMRHSQIYSLMAVDEEEEEETQVVPLVARDMDTQVVPLMAREKDTQIVQPNGQERDIQLVQPDSPEMDSQFVQSNGRERDSQSISSNGRERDSQFVQSNGREGETQMVPLVARERDTQPLPSLPRERDIPMRSPTLRERNIQLRSPSLREREIHLRSPSLRERDIHLRSPILRERELQLRPSTPRGREIPRPSTPRERDNQLRPSTSRDRSTMPLPALPRDRNIPPVPPMPRDRDSQLVPLMAKERDSQTASVRSSPRSQMVPIMVQEKPRQHVSKMVENFTTNLEDDILSGHLPVDFSTYQPYELVPRRYSISAPKKHVEFSLPYDDTDSESMIYPHVMPIPLKKGTYRTIEPMQRKESKGRFRAFFGGSKDKGPVATVAIPRKSVNSYDFILM